MGQSDRREIDLANVARASLTEWSPRGGPSTSWAQSARGRFEAIATAIERLADLTAVTAAVLGAYKTYELLNIGKQLHYPFRGVITGSFAVAILFVFLLDRDGAYARASSLLRIRETERILRVSMTAFGLVFPVTFFLAQLFSRWAFGLAFIFVPLVLTAEKQLLYVLIRHLHTRGYGRQNVILYGAGMTSRRLFSALVRSPKLGLNPIAFVDDNPVLTGQKVFAFGYRRKHSAPVISGPLTADLISAHGASMVIVGVPTMSRQRIEEVAATASAARATVAFVPRLTHGTELQTEYADIDGLLIAAFAPAVSKPWYEIAKRLFDSTGALALLVVTAPIWAAAAILIRWDSWGPVFFTQTRIGRDGRPFTIYKFRSMHVSAAPYGLHPSHFHDPRVTRIGRWLRRTSLDELPQLINVLRGDMSLVGPRPEMPFIVTQYDARHKQRLRVKPGVTGLWQLSADRAFLIHENIHYDLYYIRHRNFFMDLAILMHTAMFVMKGM